ncbi:MAG: NAD(P)/FAD-dependent oxidoreductase, partial [Saprospiraceae bacterium]
MSSNVIICGAGLCGTLLALRLADRGHHITLLEKRNDLRYETVVAGRSINLALSDRGMAALDLVGLQGKAMEISIPMMGRMVHSKDGGITRLLPYSGRSDEFIQSISRHGLNELLLNAAAGHNNIEIHFGIDLRHVDVLQASIRASKSGTTELLDLYGDILIGTDGAGSAIRQGFLNIGSNIRFNYSQDFLDHGYKELEIPAGPNGTWRIEKNALHIWPRHNYMLIALPNLNGSFTVTLFLPFDSEPGFNQLNNPDSVLNFFTSQFPDVVPLMPNLVTDFMIHPTGSLGTIRCN